MRRRPGPHRVEHVEVVVAVEVGVDAALQAHLGRTLGLGLGHAPRDLVELEQVGGAPQVQRQRALGERAEAALERAHVRVVDVAVADEGHRVAHRLAPQVVGDLGHQAHLGPPGGEQVTISAVAHLLAEGHPRQDLGHGATAGRSAASTPRVGRVGRTPRARRAASGGGISPPEHQEASRASPSASEASSTGKRSAGSSQRSGSRANVGYTVSRGASTCPAASVAPRSTASAGQARSGLTWSAVTGETPPQSSMPACEQGCQVVGQVRRRLHVDLGRQHQPGRRDGPLQVVGRAGLGAAPSPSRAWAGSSGR